MEDARALLDAAEWTSAHVVGHSMGGVIAQRLALSHPHRVKSLALLCTVACGADAVRMTPRMIWISLRTHLGTRALRRRAFLELICPPESLADRDCALLATEFAPLFGHDLAEQPQIALRQALALRRHDCTGELESVGQHSHACLEREARPYCAAATWPKAGHSHFRRTLRGDYLCLPRSAHHARHRGKPPFGRTHCQCHPASSAGDLKLDSLRRPSRLPDRCGVGPCS